MFSSFFRDRSDRNFLARDKDMLSIKSVQRVDEMEFYPPPLSRNHMLLLDQERIRELEMRVINSEKTLNEVRRRLLEYKEKRTSWEVKEEQKTTPRPPPLLNIEDNTF